MRSMTIFLKRIYEEPSKHDGKRILIDRLWPRGVSKKRAALDQWLKNIGPSHALRQWFQHDPEKFLTFRQQYIKELQSGDQKVSFEQLKEIYAKQPYITLLF